MPNDTILPDDDRDLRLAQHLGQPESHPADPTDATFSATLDGYRTEADRDPAHTVAPNASARMWQNIATQTQLPAETTRHDRPAQAPARLRLVPRTWVAVAASVLLLVALNWLFEPFGAPVTLVAQAGEATTTYTTPDGSTITLRPHSSLYAVAQTSNGARYRLIGEGFFDVTKLPDRVFTVEVGQADIAVLGTRFNASTWGNMASVYLEEGRIRFGKRAAEEAVVLTPGQQSALTEAGTLLPPAEAEPTEHTDWLAGELTFQQKTLDLILAELQQHYQIRFAVSAERLQETFSGRILLTDVAQSLRDLGIAMGGRFEQAANGAYRFIAE